MRVVDTNGDSLLAQTEIDQLQATSPELAQVDLKKDGDEILHVSGKIVLPHGKEGSKEILEAKFRTFGPVEYRGS
eukprot:s1714_g5.t1